MTLTDAFLGPDRGRWRRYAWIGVAVIATAVAIAFVLADIVTATRSSDDRLTQVLEELQHQRDVDAESVTSHRHANQSDHNQVHEEHRQICEMIRGIARQRNITTEPCEQPR